MIDRELQEKIAGAEIFRRKRSREFGEENFEPFYERGKIRPDKKAIQNLDALPRPKTPPGRRTGGAI